MNTNKIIIAGLSSLLITLNNGYEIKNEAAIVQVPQIVVTVSEDEVQEEGYIIYDIPLSTELQRYTYDTCIEYGIQDSYELILAMMWRESHFDAEAVSSTNDYGIMQINRCNLSTLEEQLGIVDIMDAESNIESGVYILSGLLLRYEDESKALMAYNMGQRGAAAQWAKGVYSTPYSEDILEKAELIKNNQYSEK